MSIDIIKDQNVYNVYSSADVSIYLIISLDIEIYIEREIHADFNMTTILTIIFIYVIRLPKYGCLV